MRSLSRDPLYIEERRVRLRYPPLPGNRISGPRIKSSRVFVGNLPFVLEEHELREKFAIFGKIVDVKIGAQPLSQ